jgi:hypothetical protein
MIDFAAKRFQLGDTVRVKHLKNQLTGPIVEWVDWGPADDDDDGFYWVVDIGIGRLAYTEDEMTLVGRSIDCTENDGGNP